MGKRTIFFKKIENSIVIPALGLWSPSNAQLNRDSEIAKHAPFNSLTVYNESDKDCEVRLYGTNIADKGVEPLPAGATLQWDDDEIEFYRPTIYNKNAVNEVAVNKIIIVVRKKV